MTALTRRTGGVVALGLLALLLAGCLVDDTNYQDALYKLPEKSRVLVWVDPRSTADMPVDTAPALGQSIAQDLYTYKVAGTFVAQSRLSAIRQDPKYKEYGIADVARLTDADLVVYVDMLTFHVTSLSSGQLTEGGAEAVIKVVDKNGKRLWPDNLSALGYPVTAHVDINVSEDQSTSAVRTDLIANMTKKVGQLFHKWDKGGAIMDHTQKVE